MIESKTIEEHLASLSNRISKLETGGKPMVSFSEETTQQHSFTNTGNITFTFQFQWPNDNVLVHQQGIFIFDVQCNIGGGFGNWENFKTSLRDVDFMMWYPKSDLDSNENRSTAKVRFDFFAPPGGEDLTVRVRGKWMYISGGSAS